MFVASLDPEIVGGKCWHISSNVSNFPHLDYASAIWYPHLMKDKDALENVQKRACRMATRIWDSSYQDLLELVNIPTLEH